MTVNKRSKHSRYRGSKTHGCGSMKKRRGAGLRGGRGAAGSGKRGDAKKPRVWKNPDYGSGRGFTSKNRKRNAPVTLRHLESFTKTLTSEGYLAVKDGSYQIDLGKAGYTKLLATGTPTKKWTITVPEATDGAIEKVKKAGGSVTTTAAADEPGGQGA